MQYSKSIKLQKQSQDGTISMTFPKKLVDKLGYKIGDKIEFTWSSNNPDEIILKRPEN